MKILEMNEWKKYIVVVYHSTIVAREHECLKRIKAEHENYKLNVTILT